MILLFNTLNYFELSVRVNYTDSVSTSSVILKKFVFPRYYHTAKVNTTTKVSLREIIKIASSPKINPREIWKNLHPGKLI